MTNLSVDDQRKYNNLMRRYRLLDGLAFGGIYLLQLAVLAAAVLVSLLVAMTATCAVSVIHPVLAKLNPLVFGAVFIACLWQGLKVMSSIAEWANEKTMPIENLRWKAQELLGY